MTFDIISWCAPPVVGAAIGYATNALAVKMLFRPHNEVRLGPLRFQGMIPRRKPELAKAISRIVFSELLREESLAEKMAGAEFKAGITGFLVQFARERLDREFNSLRVELGDERAQTLARGLEGLLAEGAGALAKWLDTEEGACALDSLAARLGGQGLGELLGESRAAVTDAVAEAVRSWAASDGAETDLRALLSGWMVRLASVDRPVAEMVDPEALKGVKALVESFAPPLLERFEELLFSEEGVARIKGAVRQGVDRYLLGNDGGLVKNVARSVALMGRDRIVVEVDKLVEENIPRLKESVLAGGNREKLVAGVWSALEELLESSPSELLAKVDPATLDSAYGGLAAQLGGVLSKPGQADRLAKFACRQVESALETPLSTWFDGGEKELAARARTLAGSALGRWGGDGATVLSKAAIGAKIGRPLNMVSDETLGELAGGLVGRLMPHVASSVAELMRLVGVEKLIEEEVLAFSSRRLEEVILQTAGRELGAITLWGLVLGGLVGVVQAVVFNLFIF
jgi:uncharacterized membrane protein YheB (UPF0754 family)